ncbi:MAG: fibronectin type III domain-containing protein [Vicinamibacterales bacterium]
MSWTPGGGGAAMAYVLSAALSSGGVPIVTAPLGGAKSATFTQVPPGTYFVKVSASNGVGTSPPSNEVLVVVP